MPVKAYEPGPGTWWSLNWRRFDSVPSLQAGDDCFIMFGVYWPGPYLDFTGSQSTVRSLRRADMLNAKFLSTLGKLYEPGPGVSITWLSGGLCDLPMVEPNRSFFDIS